MVKIIVIDFRTMRRKVTNTLFDKENYKLMGKASLFVLASVFAGIAAAAPDLVHISHEMEANKLLEETTSLFNDMSEELNKGSKNI